MDASKQIRYWADSSEEDIAAAMVLHGKGHWRQCLFFTHLAIEKMLKAHVVKRRGEVPPRIHSLIRLSETAGLRPDEGQEDFLRGFGVYQLEGRYPDSQLSSLDSSIVEDELSKAREILEWLKKQL